MDTELLQQFKAVEQMNEANRTVIKRLIDAVITKAKIGVVTLLTNKPGHPVNKIHLLLKVQRTD
jgi:hypothetical protein